MEKSNRQNTVPFAKNIVAAAALSMALASGLALSACNSSPTGPAANANAKITLTAPKGGQSFKVGDSLTVTWTIKEDDPDPVTAVDVEISPDSGKTWGFLNPQGSIPPGSTRWEKFGWRITPTVLFNGAAVSVVSDHVFFRVEQYSTHDTTKISTTTSTLTITAQ